MIKLAEQVTGSLHTLTAIGSTGAGKTHLLDRIADGCEAWGFRVNAYSRDDHCLALTGSRRRPISVLPQIAAAASAFGFAVVPPKYGNDSTRRLQLERKDRP